FQAEDGIRDKLVTGVQTCALPIYRRLRFRIHNRSARAACAHALLQSLREVHCRLAEPVPRIHSARKRGGRWQLRTDGSAGSQRQDRKSVVEGKRVDWTTPGTLANG